MWNVKTLADNEAISNEDYGYMNRYLVANNTVCIIGDKVEYWSTNTLESGYTKTN